MATSTVENYVKILFGLSQQNPEKDLIPMGKLAEAMHVVPGTATTMVRALEDAGLVHYEARNGVKLSSNGRKLALHVLRRHRLIEKLLVDIIGLDWSEVHEEAENLEHVISDHLLEKIDELLGHPEVDPHGDPIPTPKGTLAKRITKTLADCVEGESITIARVSDKDPEFLQYLDRNQLKPDTNLKVIKKDPYADALLIRAGKNELTLGSSAASRIYVK